MSVLVNQVLWREGGGEGGDRDRQTDRQTEGGATVGLPTETEPMKKGSMKLWGKRTLMKPFVSVTKRKFP